jgi:uncharacterized protein (DUF983 family)
LLEAAVLGNIDENEQLVVIIIIIITVMMMMMMMLTVNTDIIQSMYVCTDSPCLLLLSQAQNMTCCLHS